MITQPHHELLVEARAGQPHMAELCEEHGRACPFVWDNLLERDEGYDSRMRREFHHIMGTREVAYEQAVVAIVRLRLGTDDHATAVSLTVNWHGEIVAALELSERVGTPEQPVYWYSRVEETGNA